MHAIVEIEMPFVVNHKMTLLRLCMSKGIKHQMKLYFISLTYACNPLIPFRSESPIHSDYDVLLVGDMLFDEDIGSRVTQLAGSFRGLTLVGDPGKVMSALCQSNHLICFKSVY